MEMTESTVETEVCSHGPSEGLRLRNPVDSGTSDKNDVSI